MPFGQVSSERVAEFPAGLMSGLPSTRGMVMRKFVGAGLLALSCVMAAAPAQAATDLGEVALVDLDPSANFLFSIINFYNPSLTAGSYTIKYTFGFPVDGFGAGNLSANLVGSANTLLTNVTLNGFNWNTAPNGLSSFLFSGPVVGLPSINEVVVNFDVVNNGIASFNGSVSAAVPEPATWALMVLGVGMIGFGMRRRQQATTRVSYSMA